MQRILDGLRSLRAAVILAALFGVALPTALLSYADLQRLRGDAETALDADVARTAELLAMSMREPIWQFAPDQAQSIIEASLLDMRILEVQVFDSSGRVFAAKKRDGQGANDALRYTTSVTRQEQRVGHVEVAISKAGYQQAIAQSMNRVLLNLAISIVASVVVITWLLHIRLVKPVDRLVKASQNVAGGNLAAPIPPGTGDELGRLSESLGRMRDKLAGLVAELEGRNEELRVANEQLEARVAQRTAELETALEKLVRAQEDMVESEKLASLGRIVAGVAHELNTPIGNALTVASTVNDSLRPLIVEFEAGSVRKSTLAAAAKSDAGLNILMRNLEKAAKMIANFKQVAVDQTSEQRREFDLADVTEEVLSTLGPSINKSGQHVVTDLAPDLRCDSFPGPYGQVLTNLITNALMHAFPGERRGGRVTVRTEPAGPHEVRLIVEDDGAGMTAEVKRRIFDPFFTTSMGRGGSGLGMNICQGFVNRVLGGTIRVESALGSGSRFTVEFPRTAPKGH